MNRTSFQSIKPQLREVWRLSLPAILTQITTIAMQYIDSAMVGRLGANASAAIGIVASSTWLMNGVCYALAAGFSVQVAHRIGAGNEKEARNVVRHGLLSAGSCRRSSVPHRRGHPYAPSRPGSRATQKLHTMRGAIF